MKKLLFLPLLVLLLWQVPSYADSAQDAEFQRGVEAYDAKDSKKAFEILKPLAESGHVESQSYLGVLYYWGFGVEQDYKEAFKWYLKAAEQGHAIAQYYLGEAYLFGYGVAKDRSEAKKWYLKAAEQGDVDAEYSLESLE